MTPRFRRFRTRDLVVRTDAGASIGLGHLMRSLALALEWTKEGGQACFLTSPSLNPASTDRVRAHGIDCLPVPHPHPDPADLATTLAVLRDRQTDSAARPWLVLDGYHFAGEYQHAIREAGYPLLVLDDIAHLPEYHANILANQNAGAETLSYRTDPDTRLLLGTRYCLLRPQYHRAGLPPVRDYQRADRLLVTMGGADRGNLTARVLRALGEVRDGPVDVRVVVGEDNRNLPELEELIRCGVPGRRRIELIRSPSDMAGVMADVDIAIAAAGSTCWELCYMRLPSIVLVVAQNQVGIADGLARACAAYTLGWAGNVSQEQLVGGIEALSRDGELRRTLGEQAGALVDGRGAKRVVQAMQTVS